MQYKGQAMSEYVGDFENQFNRLTALGSSIDEDLKVATFLASFGDKTRSSSGHLVTVLQSKESGCSWETVSSAMLQEYEEQTWALNVKQHAKRGDDGSLALTAAGQRGTKHGKQSRKKDGKSKDKRRCWDCGQLGHYARDHRGNGKKNTPGIQSSGNQDDDENGKAHHATMFMALRKKLVKEIELLMDSGASDHMVNNADWLTDIQSISPKVIIIGNGDSVTATHQGTLVLTVKLQGGVATMLRTVRLQRVLLVPELAANLLSCSALCRDGCHVTFNRKVCVAWDKQFIELQGLRCGGVYIARGTVTLKEEGMAMTANRKKVDLWHDRLGHAHIPSIQELSRKVCQEQQRGTGIASFPESRLILSVSASPTLMIGFHHFLPSSSFRASSPGNFSTSCLYKSTRDVQKPSFPSAAASQILSGIAVLSANPSRTQKPRWFSSASFL